MKKYLLLLIIPFMLLTACDKSDEPQPAEPNGKTLLMYMPWSSNLTTYFYQNIKDMEACIEQMGGLSDQRVLVFLTTTDTESSLF